MPIQQCQNCGYVVTNPSHPCVSCGSLTPQPSTLPIQAFTQPLVHNNYGGAAEFSVGTVLSRSFSTFFKQPIIFLGLAFLTLIPGVIIEVFMRVQSTSNFADALLRTLMQGAIAYCVFRALKGESTSIGESLKRGSEHIGTLFLVGLLEGLAILSVAGLLIILSITLIGKLSFLLPVVPVSILVCMWFVSYPACVVERLGAMNSLKRSAGLTKGHRWKIFGLLLLMLVALIIPLLLLSVLVPGAGDDKPTLVSSVTALLIYAPLTAFYSVVMAVTYYSLREAKEGVSIDQLANVFD